MIAIIPARGGSKGLPGKNIRPLLDKPLISYTIEAALNCPLIERVLVSTDDHDIARIARESGAEVPFIRPDYLASDTSSAVDVYLHALEFLSTEGTGKVDEIVILLPTVPLRTSDDIKAAIELFKSKNADSVLSFTPENHPISWHRYLNGDGKIEVEANSTLVFNRQEYRETYYPNGAIYVLKSSLLEQRTYYSDNTYAYIMPANRSVDIDTIDDFRYAEYLIKNT